MQRTYYSFQYVCKEMPLCMHTKKKIILESNNEMGTEHWCKAAQIK